MQIVYLCASVQPCSTLCTTCPVVVVPLTVSASRKRRPLCSTATPLDGDRLALGPLGATLLGMGASWVTVSECPRRRSASGRVVNVCEVCEGRFQVQLLHTGGNLGEQ